MSDFAAMVAQEASNSLTFESGTKVCAFGDTSATVPEPSSLLIFAGIGVGVAGLTLKKGMPFSPAKRIGWEKQKS